jgi:hypothetical protein
MFPTTPNSEFGNSNRLPLIKSFNVKYENTKSNIVEITARTIVNIFLPFRSYCLLGFFHMIEIMATIENKTASEE